MYAPLKVLREARQAIGQGFQQAIRQAEFSENVESHLSDMVIQSFGSVKEYSTNKLAQILSECISWRGDKPRLDADWFFAEENVDARLGKYRIVELSEKGIILGAYESLPREATVLGHRPRDDLGVIHHGGIRMWLPYKEDMKKLPENDLKSHLMAGFRSLHGNMDLFLGREIFEVYQSMIRGHAKFPEGYGEIRVC